MPRPFQYTRRRFQLMQVGMCLLLGVSIGVAMLVDHSRAKSTAVELDRMIQIGEITLLVPGNWDVANDESRQVLHLTEPGAQADSRRALTVRRRTSSWLEGFFAVGNPRVISFGQFGKGVLLTTRTTTTTPQAQGKSPRPVQLLARLELPDGDLLEITLETSPINNGGIESPDDVSLIKQIAASARRAANEDEP